MENILKNGNFKFFLSKWIISIEVIGSFKYIKSDRGRDRDSCLCNWDVVLKFNDSLIDLVLLKNYKKEFL